jgi:hypothetical protein
MKRNLVIKISIGFCLVATIAFFAFNRSGKSTMYSINFVPAKTSNELVAIRNNPHANVVKTISQFDNILALNETPLNTLPKEVIDEFRSQLVVRQGVGIVGLRYGTIKKLLSDDDFATVMAMFGIDTKNGFWGFSKNEGVLKSVRGKRLKAFFEDYNEYRCSAPHTCSKSSDDICLSGC